MKASAKYKTLSVTVSLEMEQALSEVCRKEIRKNSEVVQEALRLYFRARRGKVNTLSLAMPTADEERKHIDWSAFAPEWSSVHDRAYDILGRK